MPTRCLSLLLALLLAGCSNTDRAAHEEEVMTWREARLQDLSAEDSWLTLIDYHRLNLPTSVGTGGAVNLRLPRGPAFLGMFYSSQDGATLGFGADSTVTADGVPMQGWTPVYGADGRPIVFRYDDLSWHVREFQDRLSVRVRDNRADLRINFPGLTYYDVNPDWRLEARYEAYDPPKQFPVAIFTGGDALEEAPGRVVFEVDGQAYSLDVTESEFTLGQKLF